MSIFASKMFLFICKGISMSYWEKIKNFIKGKRVLKTSAFFKNSTTKHSMNHCCTLKMSTKTEEIKKEISQELKAKIKKYIKTPEKLVQYLQLKGVEVYKLKNAENKRALKAELSAMSPDKRAQRLSEIKAEKDAAERCIEAVKLLLADEVDEAMNRFNRKVAQE